LAIRESIVSNGDHASDAPHWPLIRVTPFWDVFNQAKSKRQLCEWLSEHADSEMFQMYWPVPNGSVVLCMSHVSDSRSRDAISQVERPELPRIGMPLPEVKFVRLSPYVVQLVMREAAHQNMFQQSRIRDDGFFGGLSVMEDYSDASGPYQSLPSLVELGITSASLASTDALEMIDIVPPRTYIDECVYQHIGAFLREAPNDAVEVKSVVSNLGTNAPSGKRREVSVVASNPSETVSLTTIRERQVDPIANDDPYKLKGRSDGVYILYKIAERCSLDHAFADAENADDRYRIATTIFDQLLDEMAQESDSDNERQKKLRRLFLKTRLRSALKLIRPTYDHNSGLGEVERREEWPPAMGKALLAEPDERRQKFVTDMLAIILRGVQHWSDYDANLAEGVTRREALKQWLEDHGVTGKGQLPTAFAVIAWNGTGSIPTPPKSATR
jgi:hypothetical protein